MNMLRWVFVVALLGAAPVLGQVLPVAGGQVKVDKMLIGLDEPWAIGFLPDGGLVVTERSGQLLHFTASGKKTNVRNVPKVADVGQGGLLDVVVARDFATTRTLFLSYARPVSGGAATAVMSARLSPNNDALTDTRILFQMSEGSSTGRHFGSRIVEAQDGSLFITLGDRGARDQAQNLNVHNGKVVRVTRAGKIPGDNPFAGGGGQPEIWSYGHRNLQGAAMGQDGRLWTVEHGAKGGDEVNKPEAGKNYGWPVISYGVHYSGAKIGAGTAQPGMEQPAYYWDPSIAPSGMMVYSGKLFPDWQGDIFIGSLKFNYISRLDVNGDTASEAEQLFRDRFSRIRDVREAPDGAIWFLSVGDGAAYRITPG